MPTANLIARCTDCNALRRDDRADCRNCGGQGAVPMRDTRPYFVTVRDGARSGFLLGPYDTHSEALENVDRGRHLAESRDGFAGFYSYGTARAPKRATVFGR